MRVLIAAFLGALLAPLAYATDINISYSGDFQEKLEEDYGPKEGEKLAEDIRKDLEHEFRKANIDPARVTVVILDAKPNRPTMQQLSDRPGLDMLRSKSIGGMDMKGQAYDAEGNLIAEVEYDWYETDIRNVVASSVWSDANRASRRFARKLTEAMTD